MKMQGEPFDVTIVCNAKSGNGGLRDFNGDVYVHRFNYK